MKMALVENNQYFQTLDTSCLVWDPIKHDCLPREWLHVLAQLHSEIRGRLQTSCRNQIQNKMKHGSN